MPSATAARERLLGRMNELEVEMEENPGQAVGADGIRNFWQLYSYSYNESLTGCAAQLQELERYAKLIVGEQG